MGSGTAQTIFYGQLPGEERFRIIIEISSPYKSSEHENEWLCDMSAAPLFRPRGPIHAGDALQALGMALSHVLATLDAFRDEGGRLTYESGDDVPLKAYTFGIAAGDGYSADPV